MLLYHSLDLAMFSGKGGVGKTTLSCAFARRWAQQFPNQQILLISTDPAHSLGDVLQMQVEDSPRALPDLPNLHVRSLNAEKLLQTFRSQHGEVLQLLVERGSFISGDDLAPVWDLGFPGLDELMSLLEIQRMLREQVADRIVVDMAPSGHTLNLFGLMDFLDNFLAALALFQTKHQVISQSLTGQYTTDAADRFLAEMTADLVAGRQLLQDSERSACLIVAIAEPMSYLETQRFLASLQDMKIAVRGMFVNRWDEHQKDTKTQRFGEQRELTNKFLLLMDSHPVFTVPLQDREPVGSDALDRLFAQIQLAEAVQTDASIDDLLPISFPPKFLPSLNDFMVEKRRLILVGGKGGVGKTTVSAAIGWGMAARHPDCRVRVISIDPAHSLADAFGMSLGHQPMALTPNLTAQEIDAKQVLEQFRQDYLWELAEMISGRTDDGLQIAYAPQAWRQIVSQALPGIDEMLSLITVIDLLEQNQQDLIILDTAPTGHLLRFLQMSTALADWLAWIFKLWIKYQDVVGQTEFMGRLRSLRQQVIQAQKYLKDPTHTEFIGVLQAQSAILAETERLTQSLAEMRIHQRYLVQNRYEPEGESPEESLENRFKQTIVRLPELPGCDPFTQIKIAAELLFE